MVIYCYYVGLRQHFLSFDWSFFVESMGVPTGRIPILEDCTWQETTIETDRSLARSTVKLKQRGKRQLHSLHMHIDL
jgi:hypothetical protein